MAYTRAWDEAKPNGATTQANTLDTEIHHVRIDLRERICAAFAMSSADFAADPIVPRAIALTHGTITTDVNTISATVTWNNVAVTFTALEINVTSTASAAASKLIDLQVAGVTQFNVTKAGAGTLTGALAIGGALTGVTSLAMGGALTGVTTITTSGAINGQTISATASFTGTVGITGVATFTVSPVFTAGIATVAITSGLTLTGATITGQPTWSSTQSMNISGSSGSTTGNAATATALQTGRAINGVTFDGTAAITVTAAAGTLTGATLNATVTASSLTSVGTLSSLTLGGALTYGGVTLSNSVTGTGSMALSASPTFTGTVIAAAITASGNVSVGGDLLLTTAGNNRITVASAGGATPRPLLINASTTTIETGGLTVTLGGLTVSAGTTAVQALTATTGAISSSQSALHMLNVTNTATDGYSSTQFKGSDTTARMSVGWGNASVGVAGLASSAFIYVGNADPFKIFTNGTLAVTVASTQAVTFAAGITATTGTFSSTLSAKVTSLSRSDNVGDVVLTLTNSNATATNQYGMYVQLTGDPNDATRYFIRADGNVTPRFIVYSNGSIVTTGTYSRSSWSANATGIDFTGVGTNGIRIVHVGSTGADAYIGTASSAGGSLITGSAAYSTEYRNDAGHYFGIGSTLILTLTSGSAVVAGGLTATTGTFSGAVSGITTLAGSGAVSGFTTAVFSSTVTGQGGLIAGSGGATVTKWLTVTDTWDPGSLAADTGVDRNITVAGAAIGDLVLIDALWGANDANYLVVAGATVTSADNVRVTLRNVSPSSAIDAASHTFRVFVLKF